MQSGEPSRDVAFDPRVPADASLVVRAGLGDREALDAVLRAIQESLSQHIAFILGDTDATRDVLQDVLLSIARSLIRLRDPSLFRPWAFRIATRAAVRQQRRGRRAASLDLVAVDHLAQTIEEPPFDAELVASIVEHVGALPPACGIVVRLRYLEQLSVAEVAEVLDVPAGTVKSRASYGIELLRRRLGVAGIAAR